MKDKYIPEINRTESLSMLWGISYGLIIIKNVRKLLSVLDDMVVKIMRPIKSMKEKDNKNLLHEL